MENSDDELLLLHALSDADAEATTLELLSLIAGDGVSAGDGATALVAAASWQDVGPQQSQLADDTMLLFPDDAFTHLGVLDGGGEDDIADLVPMSDIGAFNFLDPDAGVTHVSKASDGALMPSSSSSSTSMYAAEPLSGVTTTAATTTAVATGVRDTKPLPVRILPRTAAPISREMSANSAHRKRAKDELEYLRHQVQVLEQRLEDLRQHPRGSPAVVCEEQQLQIVSGVSQSSDDGSDEGDSGDGAIDSVSTALQCQQLWKRIAKRQLDEKQKAEIENLKLKQMLETQLKIAQSLSKVLRKRSDVSWLDSHHQFGFKKFRIETLSENENVFEMLAERVETLFDQVEGVLRNSGLADLSTELQDGVVKSDELDRVFLEVVDCKIVPFDVHTTAAALWKILSSSSMNVSNGVYQAIDATEDTLRAQFTITVKLRRSEAQVHVRLVGKRIVEASRVVFVWCSVGDSEGSLFGKDHLYLRESAWTVIERVAAPRVTSPSMESDPSQQHKTTILKSVMRMSPEMERDSSESSHQISAFTDVVLSGHHRNLTMLHQNAENLIISESLGTG